MTKQSYLVFLEIAAFAKSSLAMTF